MTAIAAATTVAAAHQAFSTASSSQWSTASSGVFFCPCSRTSAPASCRSSSHVSSSDARPIGSSNDPQMPSSRGKRIPTYRTRHRPCIHLPAARGGVRTASYFGHNHHHHHHHHNHHHQTHLLDGEEDHYGVSLRRPVMGFVAAGGDLQNDSARTKLVRGRGRRGSVKVMASAAPAQQQQQRRAEPVVYSQGGERVENVVIIGSGPAGYTAAIYAARANLKPLVFEGYQAGGVPGGQLMTTTEVENFPGFPEGITGPDLMDRMRRQAERWGAELHTEDVEEVDVTDRPFTITSSDRVVKANSIIIATGATARRLGLPREEEFWSRGISACAICDGASPIFKGQELAVVGGGDSATEEAVYLTKYARHVHLLVRKEKMRASKAMQDRVLNNPNITVHYNVITEDVVSSPRGDMAGVLLRNEATGDETVLNVRGLFYGIGHTPNSRIFEGQIDLDMSGYVIARNGGETSVEGVFAAGDLQDNEWRQAITAAGSGCMAALSVERYLTREDLLVEFHQVEDEVSKKEPSAQDVEMGFDMTATKHRGQYALRKLYHESERLIGVLYTSPTCGPCRTLKPILSKVVDEFDTKIHLVEIDIVEDPEIAEAAGVMGTPLVQFFKNKQKVSEMAGVKMKRDYRSFIETHI